MYLILHCFLLFNIEFIVLKIYFLKKVAFILTLIAFESKKQFQQIKKNKFKLFNPDNNKFVRLELGGIVSQNFF